MKLSEWTYSQRGLRIAMCYDLVVLSSLSTAQLVNVLLA